MWVGGGMRSIEKIASYLSGKHEVDIFTQRQPPKHLNYNKSKIRIIGPRSFFLAPFVFLFNKVDNYDMIILGGFPANLGSIINSKRIPCITMCHSPTRVFYDLRNYTLKHSDYKGKIKAWIKLLLLKHLDYLAAQKTTKIITNSLNTGRRVKKYYHRDSEPFYTGINFYDFKKGRYEDYILVVSRFTSAKRVDLVVRSMDFVKNKSIRLYVVGSGGEDELKIKKMCEKRPNVRFIGFVDQKKLVELYSNCLAVAYTPLREDWGMAPIEAGASGKATIGVNEGGLRETIIEGKTGFLITKVTPQKIAGKIDLLANNKSLAKKMGEEAYKYTIQFDWKKIEPVLDKIVSEVVKTNKKIY